MRCLCCSSRRGYRSGAQFDRTSRTDDQLPITARPLATRAGAGAADTAGVGVTGAAADRGIGAMGTAAGMAGGGGAESSHESDVLEELK